MHSLANRVLHTIKMILEFLYWKMKASQPSLKCWNKVSSHKCQLWDLKLTRKSLKLLLHKLAEIKRKQYNQPHTKQLKTIAEVQTKMEERIYKLEKLPYKDPPRVFFDPKTPNFLHNSTFSLPEVEISDLGHKIPSQMNNHSSSDQQRRKSLSITPSGSRSNNGKTWGRMWWN